MLAAIGITGDFMKWWEGKSFLTNLLSSLTGIAFAIPVALLIISKFSDEQARATELSNAQRFAQSTLDSFFKSVRDLQPFILGLKDIEQNVGRVASSSSEAGDIEGAATRIRALADEYYDLMHVPSGEWEALHAVARPRLAQCGVRWLAEADVARMSTMANGPLKAFLEMIESPGPDDSGSSEVAALDVLRGAKLTLIGLETLKDIADAPATVNWLYKIG
ncbi:hypothetical protein [Streptomyces sp. NPDC056169]|uniref:hypothetical protein n=1 Tax=Streptomyces sp. NPDC056169 TaxID=3345734 RepID=UPI0035D5D8F5